MDLNLKTLLRIIGKLLIITGTVMVLPFFVALIYGETEAAKDFIAVIAPSVFTGAMISLLAPHSHRPLKMRDGFLIVSISWLIMSLLGAVPFVINGCIPNFIDAFFEMCSGFSTTGATILKNIEALPMSMLFWRAFTHWIGGMGILVFAIALLPNLGIGGQTIVRAETPGPTLSKVTPKMKDMARSLYLIYTGFTLIETLLLMAGGLSFFDAITHSFSTMGTGGFSNYNDGAAHFHSAYVEGIITVFMILAGANFNLYYIALKKQVHVLVHDQEFRLYIFIIGVTTLMMTLHLYFTHTFDTLASSFRYAVFQDASIITTTGFATTDFNLWPTFCIMVLFLLFFIGGCSSSTAGSIKVIRILVLLKLFKRSVSMKLHPKALFSIKVNDQPLPSDTIQNIISFVFLYIVTVIGVTLITLLDGVSITTGLSATASCLGNIGPGFDAVGPVLNYDLFSYPVKLVLSFAMIAGRLELFTLMMLFSRRFWNPAH